MPHSLPAHQALPVYVNTKPRIVLGPSKSVGTSRPKASAKDPHSSWRVLGAPTVCVTRQWVVQQLQELQGLCFSFALLNGQQQQQQHEQHEQHELEHEKKRKNGSSGSGYLLLLLLLLPLLLLLLLLLSQPSVLLLLLLL